MTVVAHTIGEIRIISASAGSGKTYRLAEELTEAIASGRARPEAVVAVTFTNKAAGELYHRVRSHLLEKGHTVAAQRLAAGRIGTVNSVCSQLVSDYAFERGLPPHLDVLDEIDAAAMLERTLSQVLVEGHARELADLRSRLSAYIPDGETWDWQLDVRRVVDAARSNRIKPDQLKACAAESWRSMQNLFGTPADDAKQLNKALIDAMKKFLDTVPADIDKPKKAIKARRRVNGNYQRLRQGRAIKWGDWAMLASLDAGARLRDVAEPVLVAASRHHEHPQLHSDARRAIELVFELAARVLERYQIEKQASGVIDFVDQEGFALDLLSEPEVAQRLRGEIDLVLVDEFQDTSPIQLAIFLALAHIAPLNVWVGDQKQSIFAFRGTDPALMDAAIDGILGAREPHTLEKSWRSRPGLVHLTSDLFASAFNGQGIPESRVRLLPAHDAYPEGLGQIAECWKLDSKRVDDDAGALAAALRECLHDSVSVRDPINGSVRPVRPGDIAVLCRTNQTCGRVASALEAAGVRAALPLQGLLETLEARLVLAALRLWADPRDALAAAELARILEYPDDDEAWLSRIVEQPGPTAFADVPVIKRLVDVRNARPLFGVLEVMDAVMELIEARDVCRRLGDAPVRHANLERLRGRAVVYAEKQACQGTAATVTGFLAALQAPLPHDVVAYETEAVLDSGAVTVSTWHAAKGLEWPITVLYELHEKINDRGALGVHVVARNPQIDLDDPLANRWLRYWPTPYGRSSRNVPFYDNLATHPATTAATAAGQRETLRLLYVGWTRARDRIVLAARQDDLTAGALDRLEITEPAHMSGAATVTWGGRDLDVVVRVASPGMITAAPTAEPDCGYPPVPEERRVHAPAVVRASQVAPPGGVDEGSAQTHARKPIRLGDRISIKGHPDWAHLGNAVHGFLAADRREYSVECRCTIAERLLQAWGVADAITAQDLVEASDRLRTWIDGEWPAAVWHRELPLVARDTTSDAGTIIRGIADLVLETTEGRLIVIDHKSFPGTPAQAPAEAAKYVGQLSTYAELVRAAMDRPVESTYIHLPLVSLVVLIPVDVETEAA